MRKDVKLGFAIGGVLLAVLIVYVLVVPGGGDKRLSSAAGEDPSAQTSSSGGVSLEPVSAQPATPPGGDATAAAPPAAPPVNFTPPAGGTDPFEQPEAVASNNGGKTRDLDWSKLLNDSQMLMVTPNKPVAAPPPSASSETTVADAQQSAPSLPDITKPGPTPVAPAPASVAESENEPAAPAEPAQGNNSGNADSEALPPPVDSHAPATVDVSAPTVADTSDAASGQNVHVVAPGESFTTISLMAYGNPNLYPAIMRANPGIDPVKLRPGMKVILPPASEVKPAASAAPPAPARVTPISTGTPVSGDGAQISSNKVDAPIDPQTQYRVQPGESLYSIAKKLYGRGDRSGKIYEMNRQTIGEDMNTLKVGTVLTLPEPPSGR